MENLYLKKLKNAESAIISGDFMNRQSTERSSFAPGFRNLGTMLEKNSSTTIGTK